ncbi:MAG: hypothetical protein B7Z33_03190 [Sphingomonadales bacterium 12-68-11]|nr:MAG: hypothetical protein B7Z33_03190 [Sphingomonadales bacterium 12-68-11]OYX16875.1 MAG: hypothetical protein B7Z07_01680 [Sphingomonadales bacterium 32-67-7]
MMRWLLGGRREKVRQQASDWIAKLNGPQGDVERAAFERWYRADPDHAAAYDRLSVIFEASSQIRAVPVSAGLERPGPGAGRYAFAAAAAGVCIVLLGVAALVLRQTTLSPAIDVQQDVFAAGDSASRTLRLADGSQVVLSPGSQLHVVLDRGERRLTLRRGEGRFTVFHEARPFIVLAQGTRVTARGTQFVVRLDSRGTRVSLIEGRIEVSYPPSADRPEQLISLTAGQQLMVPAQPPPSGEGPDVTGTSPQPAMIDFDDVRLAQAVEQVNRQSHQQIRLADAAIADLRVTGAFRAGDVEGFARSVASALGLEVSYDAAGMLWLRRPPAR